MLQSVKKKLVSRPSHARAPARPLPLSSASTGKCADELRAALSVQARA